MAGTVTGEKANLWMASHAAGIDATLDSTKAHGTFAISDFSLTFDRGTVEQELVGQTGNYFTQGSLSIDGSLTQCRFGASGNSDLLENMMSATGDNQYITISGQISDDDSTFLSWVFVSCQVTGYDITMGDADTITEATIDFVVLDPYNVTCTNGLIADK